jgi:ferredoxin/flavodoxin---NADP+ reductase
MSTRKRAPAEPTGHVVAVVGAGPAGIYAARKLAASGHEVALINRDVKPGGLAEYGIYPNKYKMKRGLRKQFGKILAEERITYLGNVSVGGEGHLSLDELRGLGFSAVVLAVGAQGTKWLGVEGEEASGVFHAKDLVYWYNKLPPFASMDVEFGKRVAIIGMGNVMVDIAHWLVCHEEGVEEVIVCGRRGPAERKWTPKEIAYIAAAFDRDALAAEMDRIGPGIAAVGQDAAEIHKELVRYCEEPLERPSATRVTFQFLSSPKRIVAGDEGQVVGLEVDRNALIPKGERTACRATGETATLEVDNVVYAVGDSVDRSLGLPVGWYGFKTGPGDGDEETYSAWDGERLAGVYLVGWARKASDGLVGKARQDAERGCEEVHAWLSEQAPPTTAAAATAALFASLEGKTRVVTAEDIEALAVVENQVAEDGDLPEFKHGKNEEMFLALDADN